jgi:RNA-directed DNA polymerase
MNERGKSDNLVVPAKPLNKAARAAAEAVEGRGLAEGNTVSSTHPGRSAGPGAPSGLDRVREVARRDKGARFTALLHHVSLSRLRWAYWEIRPKAAPGVDGVTESAGINRSGGGNERVLRRRASDPRRPSAMRR